MMVMEDNEMFGGRTCPRCGRRLPLSFKGDVCAVCEEERLFEEVRDYIRTNEVTEFKLAEKFGLTQRKIQKWINEGLIQFSGSDPTKRIKGHCARCGDPLDFGSYCPSCMRMIRRQQTSGGQTDVQNVVKMR